MTAAVSFHRASRDAGRFWQAAVMLLVALPVAMAIAHRSSPLFLSLSAACALAALAIERSGEALHRAGQALRSPAGLACVGFFGWTVLSLAWSTAPALTLLALGEFWIPVLSAFVLALTLPSRMPRHAPWLLAGALVLACVIVIVQLRTGMAFRRALGVRWNSFILNRPVLTILVLILPMLAAVTSTGTRRATWLVGGAATLFTMAAILESDSGAASFGLLVAIVTLAFAWLLPRASLYLAAIAFVAAIGWAPVLGFYGERLIPDAVHAWLAESHSRDRIEIWKSFSFVIREELVLGTGFGASPRVADTAVAELVSPGARELLAVGHPHNAALQIWVELGLVGALLSLAAALLMLVSLRRRPPEELALRLSLIAAAAAVSLVGHGAWQGWWAAGIGAAVVWLRAADRFTGEKLR